MNTNTPHQNFLNEQTIQTLELMNSQAHRTRSITVVSLHYEGKTVMIREREQSMQPSNDGEHWVSDEEAKASWQ